MVYLYSELIMTCVLPAEPPETPEPQEHDGMAYPCHPYIEARESKANKEGVTSDANAGAEAGKS